jgi:hypothetical protein
LLCIVLSNEAIIQTLTMRLLAQDSLKNNYQTMSRKLREEYRTHYKDRNEDY